MSFGLDVDCQEASSQIPGRAAQQQENNTLPDGVMMDDFPFTAAERKGKVKRSGILTERLDPIFSPRCE